MEKVIFELKEPQIGIPKSSQNPTLVYMYFSFGYYELDSKGRKNYLSLKYSTGLKITPYFWKERPHYKAKETKEFAFEGFNRKLENLKNLVIKLNRELENAGRIVTPDLLRDELNKALGKGPDIYRMNFTEFIRLIIKESSEGQRLTANGKKLSSTTVKGYVTTLNHVIQYQEEIGRTIDFNNVDMKFYKGFTNYMYKKNYSTNTLGKNIKNIKVFMKEAVKRVLTANRSYQDEDFKVTEENTDQIYLKDEEIQKLYQLDLSRNERLDKVRDLFIIGCYTGLRFSDLGQIHEEHFIADNTRLRIKTIKTGEIVEIPLHWTIKEIHKKYNGKIPRSISNQKMNKYLKELCQLTGINEKVRIARTKGGLRVDITHQKHELVTVHTARRSFATNMYLAGVPTISIMKVTGHKTERAFLKYIKISQEDNAKKLAEHPFFNRGFNLKII